MPTTVSQNELEQLMRLVQEFREQSGESVTSLAARAGIRREQLSMLISGSYVHTPHFEVVAKIARAIGRRIEFLPEGH